MDSERPFRDLAELECQRRGWLSMDPTFYGYKSKREKFPRRYDFLGVIDLIAVCKGKTYAIQFTSRNNASTRRKKMLRSKWALEFLGEGEWVVLLWTWDKRDRFKEELIG